MSTIRIISTPPGFAPEYVREDWVGLELSLVTKEELRTNPRSGFKIGSENDGGYLVLRANAIEALRAAGKEDAANFWEEMPLGMYLEFRSDVCLPLT